MHDWYFCVVSKGRFTQIPLEKWEPLKELGGVADLIFFNRLQMLYGMKPNVITVDNRPHHLFVSTETRKPWANVNLDHWDWAADEAYKTNTYEELLALVSKFEVHTGGVDETP
jgi:hypothetical protein